MALVRKGRAADAVQILDAAAARSENADDRSRLARAAAEIQQAQQAYQDAADRFRLLAVADPAWPEAAEAHRAACWNAARVVAADPSQIEEYQRLLQEHLALWPEAKTRGQVASWLAPLLNRRGDWPSALAALTSVPADDAVWPAVARQIEQTTWQALGRLPLEDPAAAAAVSQVIERSLADWLQRARLEDPATDPLRVSTIQLLRLKLLLAVGEFPVEGSTAWSDAEAGLPADDPRRPAAEAWRTVWEAARKRGEGEAPGQTPPPPLDESLAWLAAAGRLENDENRAPIAQAVLEAAEGLLAELPESDPRRADWLVAAARSLDRSRGRSGGRAVRTAARLGPPRARHASKLRAPGRPVRRSGDTRPRARAVEKNRGRDPPLRSELARGAGTKPRVCSQGWGGMPRL